MAAFQAGEQLVQITFRGIQPDRRSQGDFPTDGGVFVDQGNDDVVEPTVGREEGVDGLEGATRGLGVDWRLARCMQLEREKYLQR